MEEVPITVGAGYFHAAQHSGYSLIDSIRELIDNSNAAGANEVHFSIELQKNNKFTVSYSDNGCGMTFDQFKKATELGNKKDTENNHYGIGMKQALFTMCVQGQITIKTTKNNRQTIAKISTVDSKSSENSQSPKWLIEEVETSNPNGTFIEINNVDIMHIGDEGGDYDPEIFKKTLKEIYCNLSVTYYPRFQECPTYKLLVPNPETLGSSTTPVIFEDPLYREIYNNIEDDDDKPFIKRIIETCIVDRKEITIEAFAYMKENFNEDYNVFNLVEWDNLGRRGRKGVFAKQKSGIYLQLGSRFAFLGDVWYVSNTQHHTNNLRIYVKIPKEVIPCFVNQNKSTPNVNDPRLKSFKLMIKMIINWHLKNNVKNSIFAKDRSDIIVEDEIFDDAVNEKLKKKIDSNPLKNDAIANLVPEATTDLKPKSSDLIKVLRSNLGKNSEHYEASRKDDKLIVTLNEEHPWVYNFFDKIDDEDQKQNLIALLYSRHTALLRASVIENMKRNSINRIIQEESNALREFYEGN